MSKNKLGDYSVFLVIGCIEQKVTAIIFSVEFAEKLELQAKAYEKTKDSEERKGLESKFNELEARKKLSDNNAIDEAYIIPFEDISLIETNQVVQNSSGANSKEYITPFGILSDSE